MSSNKKTSVNSLTVDESTNDVVVEQLSVDINESIDVKQLDTPVSTGISKLDSGQTDDPWYILYWLDQYSSLPQNIRNRIHESNKTSPYFQNFSESIAALLNAEYVKDNSTVPVSDIGSNITGYTYSRVMDYILTNHNASLVDEMSEKTNNMFKKNMTFIKDDTGVASKLSTDAHGNNLITDSQHYVRLSAAIPQLTTLIESKLGPMYKVLQFIQNNISMVEFNQWKQRVLVEDSLQVVDHMYSVVDHAGTGRDAGMTPPVNEQMTATQLDITS